jgi:hypothetical protein
MDTGFTQVDTKFVSMDAKIDALDVKLVHQIETLNDKFEQLLAVINKK